ncbi:MAG: hypothetical protein U0414_06960 [Polyangiaceae bacterium]
MKNHAAGVAALAEVVRTLFADFDARGKTPSANARAALALVERWLGGEAVTTEAFEEAAIAAQEDKIPFAQREKDRALYWANAAAGNLAYAARKARGWKEDERATMDAAEYALSSLRVEGVRDRAALEAIRAAAYERADKAPKPKAPKTSAPKPVRVKDELAPTIGEVANARLVKLKAVVEPARRVDDTQLRAFLKERQYPDHAAVLAFDRRYGGIVVADSAGETGMDWVYGAYACLSSEAHKAPRGAPGLRGDAALVPVIYSPNDVIYFLDGHGKAWCEDTIEGGLAPYAADADRMVARVLLYQVLFERSDKDAVAEISGKRGEEAAAALGVPPLREATDDYVHVWGDARALVFEERTPEDASHHRGPWRTRVATEQKKSLAPLLAKLN